MNRKAPAAKEAVHFAFVENDPAVLGEEGVRKLGHELIAFTLTGLFVS